MTQISYQHPPKKKSSRLSIQQGLHSNSSCMLGITLPKNISGGEVSSKKHYACAYYNYAYIIELIEEFTIIIKELGSAVDNHHVEQLFAFIVNDIHFLIGSFATVVDRQSLHPAKLSLRSSAA